MVDVEANCMKLLEGWSQCMTSSPVCWAQDIMVQCMCMTTLLSGTCEPHDCAALLTCMSTPASKVLTADRAHMAYDDSQAVFVVQGGRWDPENSFDVLWPCTCPTCDTAYILTIDKDAASIHSAQCKSHVLAYHLSSHCQHVNMNNAWMHGVLVHVTGNSTVIAYHQLISQDTGTWTNADNFNNMSHLYSTCEVV